LNFKKSSQTLLKNFNIFLSVFFINPCCKNISNTLLSPRWSCTSKHLQTLSGWNSRGSTS